MEDICIVCAEPLQFTAYAGCGHKDACSKCVARLRSVLRDQRCVYCQVPSESVFVTRFMGAYTETVPPDEFDALPGRAKRGELQYLESAQAYFDDSAHFREMERLCSYTHPRVWQDNPDATHKAFGTLKSLKGHLQQQFKLQFCDICLEGRKVFVSEQQLYTKAELERHMRGGDVEGPMAAAGFKGHPDCRFCRKRFYGENEIYQHMHSAHEQCFLCRRNNPHKFVYYRDYPDLENHFQHEHYLCPHPACLEKKFVVFSSEQELKTHTAREHGETLSKMEKKAALTLQMNFSYRRDGEGGSEEGGRGRGRGGASSSSAGGLPAEAPHPLAAVLGGDRRAVVIGGAASVPSQLQQRGRGGSRGNLQEALQASVESAQVENAMRASQPGQQPTRSTGQQQEREEGPMLSEADFPTVVGGAGSSSAAAGGRWAGAAGGGVGGAGLMSTDDFPALPGSSKSAKRRAAKKKSMASVLGGGGEVRVLNAAAGRPPLPPAADQFPALSSAAPAAAPAAAAAAGPGSAGSSAASSRPGSAEPGMVALQRDDWESVLPRLGRRPGGSLPRPPSAQEIAEPSQAVLEQQQRLQARREKRQQDQQQQQGSVPGLAAPPAAAAAAASGGPAGISAALREANRVLIEKIRSQLDAGQFAQFRQQSASWVRGQTTSQQYHEAVAELGLVSLIPDLASTCPDAAKRAELLDVHRQAFSADSGRTKGKGKWVPPEAAAVAARLAEQNSSWQCGACTLVNAPSARVCEACGQARPSPEDANNQWKQQQQQQGGPVAAALRSQDAALSRAQAAAPTAAPVVASSNSSSRWAAAARPPPAAAAPAPQPSAATVVAPQPPSADAFPALPAAPAGKQQGGGGGSSSGPAAAASSKGKKGRQSLQDFVKQTKVHPQNVWRNPALKGQWAQGGGGTLAQEERAILDAYGGSSGSGGAKKKK